jgi:tetratricopeptide (TPR) repeat protein
MASFEENDYFCAKRTPVMKRFILVFCAVLLGSCCNRSTVSSLRSAEYLISSRPDSALILLRSIDPSDLRSRKSEAKYALLMSAALDKNYIDICSDSLIQRSVNYYSKYGEPKDRMLSWYYEGICLKNGRDLIPAMIALEKAEKEAIDLGDWFYLGLIYRNKAAIFNMSNNLANATQNWRDAVSCFEKAQADVYKAYAELSLAIEYSNEKEFDLADSLLNKIKTTYPSNHNLQVHRCLAEAVLLVNKGIEPEKALDLFREVPKSRYSVNDYGYLAQAFEMIGRKDSSDYWLSVGYRISSDEKEIALLDNMKAIIEKRRGNYSEAFRLFDHVVSFQDSLTRVLLQQSVSTALRDYYKNETLLKESRIRSMRGRAIFGVVVSLLIILVLILTVITLSRKKDGLLKEQLARLAYEEKELDRLNRDNAHLLGSLFSEKIDHLDKMIDSYFKMENGKQKDLAFSNIKQQVALIRSDEELFLSLEKDLDRYCNGIMAKLRSQVPEIKGENLKIITLFFAGFSYETTLFILSKSSVESLKTTRSRIRSMIRASNAPDKEVFLKMLEMKSGRRPAQMKT